MNLFCPLHLIDLLQRCWNFLVSTAPSNPQTYYNSVVMQKFKDGSEKRANISAGFTCVVCSAAWMDLLTINDGSHCPRNSQSTVTSSNKFWWFCESWDELWNGSRHLMSLGANSSSRSKVVDFQEPWLRRLAHKKEQYISLDIFKSNFVRLFPS